MVNQRLIRQVAAVLLFAATASTAHGLIFLNFDQEIFTAPVGTPFVKITATLDLDRQHYLWGSTSHGSSGAIWADISFTYGPDPSEPNRNARMEKLRAQIGNLPGPVPPDGDYPISIPFVWGYWHLDNWQFPEAYGFPGYIGALGSFEFQSINDEYRIEFYNTTDPGNTFDNPLMLDSINPGGGFEFDIGLSPNGLGRAFPVFIDPVAATGYSYLVGVGDPNFGIVYIPSALPLGDSLFDLHVAGGTYPLTAGVPFDLTQIVPGGVSAFTITGIDPIEGLDPDDPAAFPTGLMFVGDGAAANVTMTAIPDPATFVVIGFGLACWVVGHRNTRSMHE